MENLIDRFGEGPLLFGIALCVGIVFGAAPLPADDQFIPRR